MFTFVGATTLTDALSVSLTFVAATWMLSAALLITNKSLPVPPISVVATVVLSAVSVSLPELAVITSPAVLPVACSAAVPIRVSAFTSVGSVKFTDDSAVLLAVVEVSTSWSAVLLTTKVSLPVLPVSVSTPLLETSVSASLLAVPVIAAVPVSTSVSMWAGSVNENADWIVSLLVVYALLIWSLALPTTKRSLPDPETSVSRPVLPIRVSAAALPVPLSAAEPVRTSSFTSVGRTKLTEDWTWLTALPNVSTTWSKVLLTTKVVLPDPPINVATPLPAIKVSAPVPPVIESAPALPWPTTAVGPVSTSVFTLAGSVKPTEESSTFADVEDAPPTESAVLLTTKTSLPVPPTSVSAAPPATSVSLPAPAYRVSAPPPATSESSALLARPVMLAEPASTSVFTLAGSVKLTDESTIS